MIYWVICGLGDRFSAFRSLATVSRPTVDRSDVKWQILFGEKNDTAISMTDNISQCHQTRLSTQRLRNITR
jgi:hypothetical protein